jgi:hypothetical protein
MQTSAPLLSRGGCRSAVGPHGSRRLEPPRFLSGPSAGNRYASATDPAAQSASEAPLYDFNAGRSTACTRQRNGPGTLRRSWKAKATQRGLRHFVAVEINAARSTSDTQGLGPLPTQPYTPPETQLPNSAWQPGVTWNLGEHKPADPAIAVLIDPHPQP